MKPVFLTAIILLCLSNSAVFSQFSGAFAPSKWTTVLSPGSSGSVDVSGAPASILIIGSDGAEASNVDVDYMTTTTSAGLWSFSWAYHTNDSYNDPQYDLAGILINGVFTQLSESTANLTDQSGTYTSVSLPSGTSIGFRLRATDNGYGNATFTISGFAAASGTLPVNFSFFTAQPQGGNVFLKWTTASESGSGHFEVERSVDGSSFSTVATLPAQGNSNSVVAYGSTDHSPLAGTSYYRIREVDIDGHAIYSKIVSVTIFTGQRINLYPNPATSSITISATYRAGAFPVTVRLYSSAGYLLGSRKSLDRLGGALKMDWDVSSLAPGIYFFLVGEDKQRISFIKQ